MEILVIILILVLIAQTGVFIYSHFYDINTKKEAASIIKMFEIAAGNFMSEKDNFNRILAARDTTIELLNKDYRKLAEMHNNTVHHLPNIYQKEAMKHIISNVQTEDDIEKLSEYYEWIKTIKYNDQEEPLDV